MSQVTTVEPRSVAPMILNWMDREGTARMLVTRGLMLLWANNAAKSLLAQRRDLEVRTGDLTTTHPDHFDSLVSLIENAGPKATTLALPCENGDGHVLLRAQEVGHFNDGAHIGITYHRSHERAFEMCDFRKIFGLTPAENKVLLLLLDGRTADEITAGNKVSIDTVRSQIRHIYDKLEVNSREALFRRIRPYIFA